MNCANGALKTPQLLATIKPVKKSGMKCLMKTLLGTKKVITLSCKEGEMTGIDIIAKERDRQIKVEDFSPEHDSELINGELSNAAAVYAMSPEYLAMNVEGGDTVFKEVWPFGLEWYKQTMGNRIRDLAKAGALVAAEIDRLLRLEGKLNDSNLG
jgi:hypothetical protein